MQHIEKNPENAIVQPASRKKYLPHITYPAPQITCPELAVLTTIFNAVEEISYTLRHSPVIKLESENPFGDMQLHQDVHTDEIVEKHLKSNPQVMGYASEERPVYMSTENASLKKGDNQVDGNLEEYIVTYDPLDGSSIIDNNFTVGSIFSIWPANESKLLG